MVILILDWSKLLGDCVLGVESVYAEVTEGSPGREGFSKYSSMVGRCLTFMGEHFDVRVKYSIRSDCCHLKK